MKLQDIELFRLVQKKLPYLDRRGTEKGLSTTVVLDPGSTGPGLKGEEMPRLSQGARLVCSFPDSPDLRSGAPLPGWQ